ncbi:MAG: aminoacyl-tRNA hydrolase [Thiothrix sp.]|nr:aminoacyl-tRNA hydrolase [Thiothrix sp.]HPE59304.1 aminoacyl-tRNA hydrolase [Thiolinea sp.]
MTSIRLIAGLGNPGTKYDRTRHNAGFWFVDELAKRHQGRFAPEKRFSGETCRIHIMSEPVWLLKPVTFMNRSGLSVRQLCDFFRIPPQEVLIVHDELDLAAGDVRLKQGGGHGGHNGLRDLHAHLGPDYWRLRLGIGHPGDRDAVVNYVLSAPSRDEEIAILQAIDRAADQLVPLVAGEMPKVMNELHRKR